MNEKISDSEIYKQLQQHLNKMPIGFPPSKSGSGIRLLKHLFTPEEAELATFLRFGWKRDLEPIDVIYKRMKNKNITEKQLEEKLDSMAKKGLLMFNRENDTKYYGNALLMVGMFEFQVNKLDQLPKEFIKDFHDYFDEAWLPEAFKVKGAQLRTIPIEKSIEFERNVNQFDSLESLIENTTGPYMVTNCICKQLKDLEGDPCKVTSRREICMGFGHAAKMYIEQGWGREISRDEAIEILHQNQEDGLVLQPDNSQELGFLCSCCSCCCESLSRYIKFPNPGNMTITNFYAEIDPELCTGCGICVDICPMEAIKLRNDVSSVKKKRCIGCGNCVVKCPVDAINLKKKEREFIPFPTMDDLFDKINVRKK
ncbi:MAG: 4Fe-4S dicluster domain-containing protein, partial [Promethearchaeota archaeon]